MATWQDFEKEAPDLAPAVLARLEAHRHHVLATLRRDGSPRVSGTEVLVMGADLTLGSMPDAVKVRDLRHDPRFALHANPGDGSLEGGDAKLSGLAVEIVDEVGRLAYESELPQPPSGPYHAFRLDITEVVLTSIGPGGDHLVIQSWHPGEEVRTVRRA
ncbi:pyridoxamine 5'-phosphate oxidase family protein [Kitasatospora mediocidica]|uniref:pyridoxamine 5'-phosphate oxidase family protein n=1 Tax=Kitasatospora mediocidica TaxID=58352 RepID=UPI000562ACBD|nr:pyridoxamine 5'-phosphate oxidase family protein [Kitasatospora mediocidica]